MQLNLFKKTDPICGMKKDKGKGIEKYGKWFCSQKCLKQFEKELNHKGGCC